MKSKSSRRKFLKRTSMAGVGLYCVSRTAWTKNAPSDRLRVGGIGVGGRGSGDVWGVANANGPENTVALCDVDLRRASGTIKNKAFKHAKIYRDYRKMLEKEKKNIDAVTVATPDHNHAPASVMAMKLGKHVYCEKPLSHTVKEARIMGQLAAEKGLATQMGNQGTAGGRLREGAEIVQAGGIGEVREVHVWTNRPVWPQGMDAIFNKHSGVKKALHGSMDGENLSAKIPGTLDWNLWLGPARERPFDPVYLPFNWRGWLDWGTGALGDMACHTMNLPFMALKLGAPASIEAQVNFRNPETFSEWAKIEYKFPARGGLPPVNFYWYDGRGNSPKHFYERLQSSTLKVLGKSPASIFEGQRLSGSGSLMIGTKGMIYSTDDYGNNWKFLPDAAFKDYKNPPRTLPRSPGHHKEWIIACKGGPKAMSNFEGYAGPLAEMVLLGNVAMLAGKKVEWDSKNLKVTNDGKLNSLLHYNYRKGWSL